MEKRFEIVQKCGKFSLWLLASEVAASRIEIYNKFDWKVGGAKLHALFLIGREMMAFHKEEKMVCKRN